jgi:hypothetical protein
MASQTETEAYDVVCDSGARPTRCTSPLLVLASVEEEVYLQNEKGEVADKPTVDRHAVQYGYSIDPTGVVRVKRIAGKLPGDWESGELQEPPRTVRLW